MTTPADKKAAAEVKLLANEIYWKYLVDTHAAQDEIDNAYSDVQKAQSDVALYKGVIKTQESKDENERSNSEM